jgi:hypothetical protein
MSAEPVIDIDPICGCPLVDGSGGALRKTKKTKKQDHLEPSAELRGGRPDNVGDFNEAGPPASSTNVEWPLKGLSISTCECAEGINRQNGQPCSSEPVVDTIIEFVRDIAPARAADTVAPAIKVAEHEGTLPSGSSTGAKAVRVAAAELGCTSESCVISHPQFASFARKRGITRRIDADKETRFKAAGPRNSTALLNNFNIDETLQRWARVFPELYVYPFAMSDFDQTHENLDIINAADAIEGHADLDLGSGVGVMRRPSSCLACVLNTDTSRGRGKHWVAAFVDTRPRGNTPWTVEYFNSAGRPPFASVARWMEKTRAGLAKLRAENVKKYGGGAVNSVPVTDVDHQLGDHECGLYALAYIRTRIEGRPIGFWEGDRIPDEAMEEFRRYIFRSHA